LKPLKFKGMNGTNFIEKNLRLCAFLCALFLLSFSFGGAQDLPKEIRDYKVQRAKISVVNKTESAATEDRAAVSVKIGEPELVDVSLAGITFALSAEIVSSQQSGAVDFLAFQDFRVNDLKVNVEEYKESFEFKKNQPVALPKPIKISLSAGQTLRGAAKEIRESKNLWTVTGRILVFGRFKKSFLKFKRVVPVEVNLRIRNPLKTVNSQQSTVTGQEKNYH
jgi:hypothetical protein